MWIDGFERLELIGNGGFGRVYAAWQPDFERHVAIKVLTAGGPKNPNVFRREKAALGSLTGVTGFVQVLTDGVTADGEPYLVMPLFEGSLDQRLETVPQLQALEWMVKVASATQLAHDRGIVHRDLKPANILLGQDGEPAIADLGLARLVDAVTSSGTTTCTPAFSSPAVLRGDPATASDDVYSLGATIFNIVAGRPPFHSRIPEQNAALPVMMRVAQESIDDHRPANVADGVWAVIRNAMDKDPHRRTRAARDVAIQLKLALAEVDAASPATLSSPGGDPAAGLVATYSQPRRRRRIAFLAANLAVVGAVGALVLMTQDDGSPSVANAAAAADQESTSGAVGGATLSGDDSAQAQEQTPSSGPTESDEVPAVVEDLAWTNESESASAEVESATDVTNNGQSAAPPAPSSTSAPVTTVTPQAATTTTQASTTTSTTDLVTTTTRPTTSTLVATTTTTATTAASTTTTVARTVVVPGVAGFTGGQAVAVLQSFGLSASCDTRCDDTVTGSNPGQGSTVDLGTFVSLRY